MMTLVAKYGDECNWWGWDETPEEIRSRMGPIIETLERALEEEGRASADLVRTLDLYSVLPVGLDAEH
jgi:hypothetical protein